MLPALTYGGELARLTIKQEAAMETVLTGTAAQLLGVPQQQTPQVSAW